jgi:hypothetical protein
MVGGSIPPDTLGGLAQVVERSIRIRQVGGSMPPTSKYDVVAEWLTRLTRNQFLSGAQVQILPTSLIHMACEIAGEPSSILGRGRF